MANAFFITASGTGVGKTLVTCALIHQLRQQNLEVTALKPVVTGWNGYHTDTHEILQSLGKKATDALINHVSLWRFGAPLSPDMAADKENKHIDFEPLIEFCRQQCEQNQGTLLIEGVGGVMVPLDSRYIVLDWIAALALPVILVTGNYLGSLSHSLTALAVLRGRGITISALVVSESHARSEVPLEDTCNTLKNFLDVPIVAIPYIKASKGRHRWQDAPNLLGILHG